MYRIALIFLAGGLGSVLRYGVARWAHGLAGGWFPVGTLTVNVAGSLLLGFLTPWLLAGGPSGIVDESHRVAILVGLLGGFTTFSTYAYETTALSQQGRPGLALANLLLTNALALAAAWLGMRWSPTGG